MSETSFPVAGEPLSEDEWETIALGFGEGVIDRGGSPYRLGTLDNTTNTVTVEVDQTSGRNEAILSGFVHRIDTAKTLDVPPVTTTTTYEVGLVYDPLNHSTPGGPIVLDVWTTPADYADGKRRLVLARITRAANQVLTDATVVENRQRIAPQISVLDVGSLPRPEGALVDTVAHVRSEGAWYRLDKPEGGTASWVMASEALGGYDASTAATGGTLALRDTYGRLSAGTPGTDRYNVVTRGFFDDETALLRNATPSSGYAGHGQLVLRDSSGYFTVNAPSSGQHPTTKTYVDLKKWDGGNMDPNGTAIPYSLVEGSAAYDQSNTSGASYASVYVNSAGLLFRQTSALKYKEQIREWNLDPAAVLKATPVRYVDKASGQEMVGIIADAQTDRLPELVQYGDDGEVEGFHYERLGVAQQVVLRDQAERIAALEQENAALKSELSALADRVTKLEG